MEIFGPKKKLQILFFGKLCFIKIGDVQLYFQNLSQIHKIPKDQNFICDSPITKGIVIAQSRIYFKDLESLDENFIMPKNIDPIPFLKFHMDYLFYDVGICIEFLTGLSESREKKLFELNEIYEIHRAGYKNQM